MHHARSSLRPAAATTYRCITVAAASLILLVSLACRDDDLLRPRQSPLASGAAGCGAAYTLVEFEEDSVLQAQGLPREVDTLSVCQTWTGNDYDLHVARVGNAMDTTLAAPADVPTTVHHVNGVMTFANSDGSPAEGTIQSGSVLSFINADEALVEATMADPYFNVRATGSCDGQMSSDGLCTPGDDTTTKEDPCRDGDRYIICDQEPDPGMRGDEQIPTAARAGVMTPALLRLALGAETASRTAGRHRIRRPGVRQLIESADEVARQQPRLRRFRRTTGDETTTYTVDRITGLLVAEDVESPGRSLRVTRRWRRVPGGYVLFEVVNTALDVDERGVRYPSRSISRFRDVRVR